MIEFYQRNLDKSSRTILFYLYIFLCLKCLSCRTVHDFQPLCSLAFWAASMEKDPTGKSGAGSCLPSNHLFPLTAPVKVAAPSLLCLVYLIRRCQTEMLLLLFTSNQRMKILVPSCNIITTNQRPCRSPTYVHVYRSNYETFVLSGSALYWLV